MGIYDRDYMREGYEPANRRKKGPKRRTRISIPLVVGMVLLLAIVAAFAVFLRTPAEAPIARIDYPLDLNTATFAELLTVPQIGPATAEQILKNRPFQELDELLAIYGVGESKLKIFSEYLTIAPAEIEVVSENAPEYPSREKAWIPAQI